MLIKTIFGTMNYEYEMLICCNGKYFYWILISTSIILLYTTFTKKCYSKNEGNDIEALFNVLLLTRQKTNEKLTVNNKLSIVII